MKEETRRVAYSHDVARHHPEGPWITLGRATPKAAPRNICVPVPKHVPAATPSPAPVTPRPAPAPTSEEPAPPSTTATAPSVPTVSLKALVTTPPAAPKSPAPISARVRRELEHQIYKEISGRTRGETRDLRDASRDSARSTFEDGPCGLDIDAGDSPIN